MEIIYRTYEDTEVSVLATQIECPYCHSEWLEEDMNECGTTYKIKCEECDEEFQMHFDAS